MFDNKEVLLKVITFIQKTKRRRMNTFKLIQSNFESNKSAITSHEGDPPFEDSIQIQLQQFLFDKYGIVYERKRGEYADGIEQDIFNGHK